MEKRFNIKILFFCLILFVYPFIMTYSFSAKNESYYDLIIPISKMNNYMIKYNYLYKNSNILFKQESSNTVKEPTIDINSYNIKLKKTNEKENACFFLLVNQKGHEFTYIEKYLSDTVICFIYDNNFSAFGMYTKSNDILILAKESILCGFDMDLESLNGDIIISNKKMNNAIIVNYKDSNYRNIWKVSKNINLKNTYNFYKVSNQNIDFNKAMQLSPDRKRTLNPSIEKVKACQKNESKAKWEQFNLQGNLDFILFNPLLKSRLINNGLEDKTISLCP